MRAVVLHEVRTPLALEDVADPVPRSGEVRLAVRACAICRTDLHVIDGDLPDPVLPLILGHQIVGKVELLGDGVEGVRVGDRVGVPWLGGTCGRCRWCRSARENLCPDAVFTGYGRDGGFAELVVADESACVTIPDGYDDEGAAPLLCAGSIGYRSLRLAGEVEKLGLYGFGNAARLVAQVARHRGARVYAFTRPGDAATQATARALGCAWAGDSTEPAPEALDAAIVFAPAGELVPLALASTASGGTVVCAEIHMSDIPSFPYELLWRDRVIRSVANLTRRDAVEFLALAAELGLRTRTTSFPLERADDAIAAARAGTAGTIVLVP